MTDTADKAFLQFQATGQPEDLACVFDATAHELLRVARHLRADPGVAEDLVQQTFLIAIERRGNYQPTSNVTAWLLGILTNLVHAQRRQRQRTVNPDRLQRRISADPVSAAQASELQHSVNEALHRVAEPYATVLRLHLHNGLTSAEIAKALDRKPGTVRAQVARGIEMLRRALPAGVAGAAATMNTAAAAPGLEQIRTLVLNSTPTGATSAAAAITWSTITMKKTLLAATALLLAIGGIVLPTLTQESVSGAPPTPSTMRKQVGSAESTPVETTPPSESREQSPKKAIANTTTKSRCLVQGIIRGTTGRLAGATIYARLAATDPLWQEPAEEGGENPPEPLARTTSRRDGSYVLTLPNRQRPYQINLGIVANGHLRHLEERLHVPVDGRTFSITLGTGRAIAGVLANEAGELLSGVRLLATRKRFWRDFSIDQPVDHHDLDTTQLRLPISGSSYHESVAVTDNFGRFEFTGLAPGEYAVASRSELWIVLPARASTDDRQLSLTAVPATGWRMQILDAKTGQPISKGLIRCTFGNKGKRAASATIAFEFRDGQHSLRWNTPRARFAVSNGNVFPGKHKQELLITAPGYLSQPVKQKRRKGISKRVYRLTPAKRQRVDLHVTYADNTPCADPIQVLPHERSGLPPRTLQPIAPGKFRTLLVPGTLTLKIRRLTDLNFLGQLKPVRHIIKKTDGPVTLDVRLSYGADVEVYPPTELGSKTKWELMIQRQDGSGQLRQVTGRPARFTSVPDGSWTFSVTRKSDQRTWKKTVHAVSKGRYEVRL